MLTVCKIFSQANISYDEKAQSRDTYLDQRSNWCGTQSMGKILYVQIVAWEFHKAYTPPALGREKSQDLSGE